MMEMKLDTNGIIKAVSDVLVSLELIQKYSYYHVDVKADNIMKCGDRF